MRPFDARRRAAWWPADATLLHVYALPNLAYDRDLTTLVSGVRDVTRGYPLTHVADEWLHVTVDQVTDRTAAEIPQSERDDLVAALARRVSHLPPITVMVGSVISYHSEVAAYLACLFPGNGLADVSGIALQ